MTEATMTTLNYIAIIVLSISILKILINIAIWTFYHHTRAGRIRQRYDPPTYSVFPWLLLIGTTFGWLITGWFLEGWILK